MANTMANSMYWAILNSSDGCGVIVSPSEAKTDSQCFATFKNTGCKGGNSQPTCVQVFNETGCRGGDQQYACAQVYYQKQQVVVPQKVQPPQNTPSQKENTELKSQVQQMQQEIQTLKTQQATVTQPTPTPFIEQPVVISSFVVVLIFIVGIVLKMRGKI